MWWLDILLLWMGVSVLLAAWWAWYRPIFRQMRRLERFLAREQSRKEF